MKKLFISIMENLFGKTIDKYMNLIRAVFYE